MSDGRLRNCQSIGLAIAVIGAVLAPILTNNAIQAQQSGVVLRYISPVAGTPEDGDPVPVGQAIQAGLKFKNVSGRDLKAGEYWLIDVTSGTKLASEAQYVPMPAVPAGGEIIVFIGLRPTVVGPQQATFRIGTVANPHPDAGGKTVVDGAKILNWRGYGCWVAVTGILPKK